MCTEDFSILVFSGWLVLFYVSEFPSGTNAHEKDSKKDVGREFSCGKLFYRTLYPDFKNDALYVGAMDWIFKLNLNEISKYNCKPGSHALQLKRSDDSSCAEAGKSAKFDCANHIRVIQPIGDGNQIYVCGTNAYLPRELIINRNLTLVSGGQIIPDWTNATGKCPNNPADNFLTIRVKAGNPGNHPALYSSVSSSAPSYDYGIFRNDISYLTGQKIRSIPMRTLKTVRSGNDVLENVQFVGSFDIGNHVFFFSRRSFNDRNSKETEVFSYVTRICKKDTGDGSSSSLGYWSTLFNAVFFCYMSGKVTVHFRAIQSVYKVPDDDTYFYATFTTSEKGSPNSAIFSFSMRTVQRAFDGRFNRNPFAGEGKDLVPLEKVPQPRPGQCVNDTKSLPPAVHQFVRQHSLMFSSVLPDFGQPVFNDSNAILTRLVVDKFHYNVSGIDTDFTVFYAGSDDGRVYKVAQWVDNSRKSQSILVDVLQVTPGEPILVMEISKKHNSVYVASDHRIKQISMAACSSRYDTCFQCTRDPYCGWDLTTNRCNPYSHGLLQRLSVKPTRICNWNSLTQNLEVVKGQSLYLKCFTGISEVFENQKIIWYQYTDYRGKYVIKHKDGSKKEKFIFTEEKDLVIMDVEEQDAGRYECMIDGALIRSYLFLDVKQK